MGIHVFFTNNFIAGAGELWGSDELAVNHIDGLIFEGNTVDSNAHVYYCFDGQTNTTVRRNLFTRNLPNTIGIFYNHGNSIRDTCYNFRVERNFIDKHYGVTGAFIGFANEYPVGLDRIILERNIISGDVGDDVDFLRSTNDTVRYNMWTGTDVKINGASYIDDTVIGVDLDTVLIDTMFFPFVIHGKDTTDGPYGYLTNIVDTMYYDDAFTVTCSLSNKFKHNNGFYDFQPYCVIGNDTLPAWRKYNTWWSMDTAKTVLHCGTSKESLAPVDSVIYIGGAARTLTVNDPTEGVNYFMLTTEGLSVGATHLRDTVFIDSFAIETPITEPPEINSVSPLKVKPDSVFTIYGLFSGTVDSVKMNGVKITPTTTDDDSINITVPSWMPRGYYSDSVFTSGGVAACYHCSRVITPSLDTVLIGVQP